MKEDIEVLKELKSELNILIDTFSGLEAYKNLKKLQNKYITALDNCIQRMEDLYEE